MSSIIDGKKIAKEIEVELTAEEEKILLQLKDSKNFKPSPGKSDKGFFERVRDFMS